VQEEEAQGQKAQEVQEEAPEGPEVGRLRALGRRHILALKIAGGAAAALFVIVAGSNIFVFAKAGDSTENVADVRHTQTAIVLGALVQPDGKMSPMLADRTEKALELWQAGKVDRILVTGDHDEWVYDEPDTMRDYLMAHGVPGRVIFTDHAGIDTWASMVRAKKVFGVDDAVVVTQGFHMPRALYLADAAGLDATGLRSDQHDYGSKGRQSRLREVLARVKAVGDVELKSGVLLGPEIPITGDGRASWGPSPPPGTPPAGAPKSRHPATSASS
jgi:SanA protein